MKIKFIMTFWTDGQINSTRERNLEFCWGLLKKLCQYIKNNNFDCEPLLYDFSPTLKNIEAKHIPYKLNEYKRSEKLNKIISETSENDVLFFFDSDTFFHINDFNNVLNLLNGFKDNNVYTFDLAKLNENTTIDLINNKLENLYNEDWWFAYSGEKTNGPLNGYLGGLGGVFIVGSSILKILNGFNENIKTWGGEDGEITDRFMTSKIGEIIPQKNFFPFHLNHFTDWGNKLYYS